MPFILRDSKGVSKAELTPYQFSMLIKTFPFIEKIKTTGGVTHCLRITEDYSMDVGSATGVTKVYLWRGDRVDID